MEGRIYIAKVVKNLDPNLGPVDTDPHFWNDPPTWGICRADIRSRVSKNDYVFFTSSASGSNFPQMIFGYMKIKRVIDHNRAFNEFPQKRMRVGAKINGNILTDCNGKYHPGDEGAHEDRFDEFIKHYAVGSKEHSRMLSIDEIKVKAPQLVSILNRIFGTNKTKAHRIIGQGGRKMTPQQTQDLLEWLNSDIK